MSKLYLSILIFNVVNNTILGQKLSFQLLTDLQLPNSGNANGNFYSREQKISEFLDYSGRPDILLVNSFSSETSVNYFLDNVLNVNGIGHYKYEYYDYNLGTHPWLSALFYDSTKIHFDGRLDIIPPEYFYSFVRYDLSTTDSIGKVHPLKIFTNHLSACYFDAPGCEDVRLQLAKEMDLVLGLDSLSNFIIAGHLSYTGSNDPGYQYVTQSMNYPFYDPIYKSGKWYYDSTYPEIWTGSTRNTQFDNASNSNGMTMRTSYIFLSEPLMSGRFGAKYDSSSYRIFGNDGNRTFGSKIIDAPANTDVPANIADVLYHIGNQLPIQIKIDLNASFTPLPSSISKNMKPNDLNVSLSTQELKLFTNQFHEGIEIAVYNLNGEEIESFQLKQIKRVHNLSLSKTIPIGFYVVKIKTPQRLRSIKAIANP
ncbi:T9SS type A sorting domain-containing protein [Hyphobacterium sp. CCMP332]|nr:T9SS type A sorting domain-containing protein [Hyphobacterium sp. CCMP332]